MSALLSAHDLHVSYGPIQAVTGVSLKIGKGQIVAVVGANGAGKSTIVRTLSGELTPTQGDIVYKGSSIVGRSPHELARSGIVQCPEGRRIFVGLTVRENLRLGAYGRGRTDNFKQGVERVYDIFPRLAERSAQYAGTLSGGEQQMLAIGRAMMGEPEVLLLDEPSLGLAPILVQTMFAAIREINRAGTTVLLVEQNAFMALKIADYSYVINVGAVAVEGRGADLLADEKTINAYLG